MFFDLTIFPLARDRAWHNGPDHKLIEAIDHNAAVLIAQEYVERHYGDQHEGWNLFRA